MNAKESRILEARSRRFWWIGYYIALTTLAGCSLNLSEDNHGAGAHGGFGHGGAESTSTGGNGGLQVIDVRGQKDLVPWEDGEDCRNWGCAENGPSQSALPAPSGAQACTAGNECASGFCVDGVCCDSACSGTCSACTAAKKGQGTDGTCGPITLYGDPDNECAEGSCDGAGTCKKYNGVTCGATSDCLSGNCADGYCCGAACTESCRACSVAKRGGGFNGQCGWIVSGTDPDNECVGGDCNGSGACTSSPVLANGSACTAAGQCISGFCADGVCCDKACSGTCEACTAAKKFNGTDGTCGFIAYDKNPDGECIGGKCGGTGTCMYYNGNPCAAAGDCLSTYCVDGFCCGNACTGLCQACSAAKKGGGINGQCGSIAAGIDPDNECPANCNGSGACSSLLANGSACSTGSQCNSGFCADGVCCDKACSGTCEACTAAKKFSGADGTCGFIAYDKNPDNECVNGKCSGSGTCQSFNGIVCSAASECLSGNCVDGFCCGNACTGLCQACSAAKKGGGVNGQCGNIASGVDPDNECSGNCNGSGACLSLLANGSACSTGSQCNSGFCTDGVCCDNACSGTCEACTAAKKFSGTDGTCGFIAYDKNPDNECVNGKCSGTGTCQSFNGIVCSAASECLSGSCVDGFCCGNACTGLCQACSAAKKGSGINGQCGAIAAGTDPDNECVGGECTSSSTCSALFPNGSACTSGSQCSSGICADGVCCNGACSNTCMACNLVGFEGTCTNVPSGQSDPVGTPPCMGVCDGSGTCQLVTGQACTSGSQCVSKICLNGLCVAPGPTNGPLDWITALRDANKTSDMVKITDIVARDDGRVMGTGKSYYANLGGYSVGMSHPGEREHPIQFDFSAAGAPVTVKNTSSVTAWPSSGKTITFTGAYIFYAGGDVVASFGKQTVDQNAPLFEKWCDGYIDKYADPLWKRYTCTATTGAGDSAGNSVIGQNKYDARGRLLFSMTGQIGSPQLAPTGEVYGAERSNGSISIRKFSTWGALQWTKSFVVTVASGASESFSHIVDASGNVLVAFNFSGTVDLGNGPMTAVGTNELALAKLDPMGNVLWNKRFGDIGFDLKNVAMKLTGLYDLAVAGHYAGSTNFGDGALQGSAFLAKFDTTGSILWHTDIVDAYPVTSDKGIKLSGHPSGAIFMASGSNVIDFGGGQILAGKAGFVLAKYDGVDLGNSCSSNAQCASGFCADGVCCNVACDGTCESCSAAEKALGPDGICGPIEADTDPGVECGGYACNGAGACMGIGSECSANLDCPSGFCVDGVCCDTACTGTCEACSALKKGNGFDGQCGPIATGRDPDAECRNDSCNGAGACALKAHGSGCVANAECASNSCVANTCCSAVCNSACTDTQSDPANCGECGFACGTNQACVGGLCANVLTQWPIPIEANYSYAINSGNGTVIDNNTQMMWQYSLDPASYTLPNAKAYCDNLALGGHTDWRLPSRVELVTISWPVHSLAFPNTPSTWFWSATRADSTTSWAVHSSNQQTEPYTSSTLQRVRCVRGGVQASSSAGRFIVDRGAVFDTRTNLTWQQFQMPGTYNSNDYSKVCSQLKVGGSWRLPTVKEFHSILEDSEAIVFAGAYYWTGSGLFFDPTTGDAWTPFAGSDNTAWVRCVR